MSDTSNPPGPIAKLFWWIGSILGIVATIIAIVDFVQREKEKHHFSRQVYVAAGQLKPLSVPTPPLVFGLPPGGAGHIYDPGLPEEASITDVKPRSSGDVARFEELGLQTQATRDPTTGRDRLVLIKGHGPNAEPKLILIVIEGTWK